MTKNDEVELELLRDFYERTLTSINNSVPVNPGALEFNIHNPMDVLAEIADALPDRRHILRLGQ